MTRRRRSRWTAIKIFWGDGSPYRSCVFVFEGPTEGVAAFIAANPQFFPPSEDVWLAWRHHAIMTWHNQARFFRWLADRNRRRGARPLHGWHVGLRLKEHQAG